MLNRLPLDEKKHLVMIVFFVLFLFASGFFIQYGLISIDFIIKWKIRRWL